MKLLSLSSKNNRHYTAPDPASTWPWPYCHQPRTLSFRDDGTIFKTINSAFAPDASDQPSLPIAALSSEESPSFSTAPSELPDDRANEDDDDDGDDDDDDDADAVESLIRGARSERRLFFEQSWSDTSSILADQSSRSNAKADGDACKTNADGESDVAFKKENVTLLSMESRDPYEDFRKSMEEMVEAHGVKGDDWECLEELLCWYLRVNDRDNHGYIYGAFVDLLVHGDHHRHRRHRHECRIPGHQSPSSPLSLYNTSSSSLSSSSSSSLSARCISVSEAEETVGESTSCSSSSPSSGVSPEVVEEEGQLRRSSSSSPGV